MWQNLTEVLEVVLEIERKFKGFLDDNQVLLQDSRSREVMRSLRGRLESDMAIVNSIETGEYAWTEWLKEVPDYNNHEWIPPLELNSSAGPRETVETVLGYLNAHLRFYQRLRERAAYEKTRQLFLSLHAYKTKQVKEAKAILDSVLQLV